MRFRKDSPPKDDTGDRPHYATDPNTGQQVRLRRCPICADTGIVQVPPTPRGDMPLPEDAAQFCFGACHRCVPIARRCPSCQRARSHLSLKPQRDGGYHHLSARERLWLDVWHDAWHAHREMLTEEIRQAGGRDAWRKARFERARELLRGDGVVKRMPSAPPAAEGTATLAELEAVRARVKAAERGER